LIGFFLFSGKVWAVRHKKIGWTTTAGQTPRLQEGSFAPLSAMMLVSFTSGMVIDAYPGGGRPLEGAVNRFTDTAFDAQYQYISAAHTAVLGATWIREQREWEASFPAGAANPTDTLRNPAEAMSGSASGRPDSAGWIYQLDYLPWLNTKFSAQYIAYDKFNGASSNYDGSGRDARWGCETTKDAPGGKGVQR
jgi:hypothetical protein